MAESRFPLVRFALDEFVYRHADQLRGFQSALVFADFLQDFQTVRVQKDIRAPQHDEYLITMQYVCTRYSYKVCMSIGLLGAPTATQQVRGLELTPASFGACLRVCRSRA